VYRLQPAEAQNNCDVMSHSIGHKPPRRFSSCQPSHSQKLLGIAQSFVRETAEPVTERDLAVREGIESDMVLIASSGRASDDSNRFNVAESTTLPLLAVDEAIADFANTDFDTPLLEMDHLGFLGLV